MCVCVCVCVTVCLCVSMHLGGGGGGGERQRERGRVMTVTTSCCEDEQVAVNLFGESSCFLLKIALADHSHQDLACPQSY